MHMHTRRNGDDVPPSCAAFKFLNNARDSNDSELFASSCASSERPNQTQERCEHIATFARFHTHQTGKLVGTTTLGDNWCLGKHQCEQHHQQPPGSCHSREIPRSDKESQQIYILASDLAEDGDDDLSVDFGLVNERLPTLDGSRPNGLDEYSQWSWCHKHDDIEQTKQIPPLTECDRDNRNTNYGPGCDCSLNESRETCEGDDDDDHYHHQRPGVGSRGVLPLISQLCWQTQTKSCLVGLDHETQRKFYYHYYGGSTKRIRRRRTRWPSLPAIGRAAAIRLLRLDITPAHTIHEGQEIKLRCSYETRGDKLQSLSWYKNGREFYRFQPFERRQPVLAFAAPAVYVDISRSKSNTVYLTNTTLETSGRYRCEATGTTFQEANMETHIEVLPGKNGVGGAGAHHIHSLVITTISCFIIATGYKRILE